MIVSKTVFIASFSAFILGLCMPVYAEDIFKSSEFLDWSENNRSFYIRTSIGMAGLIAARNDSQHAKCLEEWYFSDEKAGEESIYQIMREYPDYHPRGIIVAVLKKQCGSFNYSER